MPDVTALLEAARNGAPVERCMTSGPVVTSAATTTEGDQARPEGVRPLAEEVPTNVEGAGAATVAAAAVAGAAVTTGHQEAAAPVANDPAREILSEHVEHLSRGDGEGDDREGVTGGTAQADTGGAQEGEPGR